MPTDLNSDPQLDPIGYALRASGFGSGTPPAASQAPSEPSSDPTSLVTGILRSSGIDTSDREAQARQAQTPQARLEAMRQTVAGDQDFTSRHDGAAWWLRRSAPVYSDVLEIGEAARYNSAMDRYRRGTPTDRDLETIAVREREHQIDARNTSTLRGSLADTGARTLGFLGDMAITAPLGGGGGAVSAGTPWVARALTPSLKSAAVMTAAHPGPWVSRGIDNNTRDNRSTFNPAGFPGPLLQTAITNYIFSGAPVSNSLARGVANTGLTGTAGFLARTGARTIGQAAEQQAADGLTTAIARTAGRVITPLKDLDTNYGTIGQILGGEPDALKHATSELLTFAVFGAMHERPAALGGHPTPPGLPMLGRAWGRVVDSAAESGASRTEAGDIGRQALDFWRETTESMPPKSREEWVAWVDHHTANGNVSGPEGELLRALAENMPAHAQPIGPERPQERPGGPPEPSGAPEAPTPAQTPPDALAGQPGVPRAIRPSSGEPRPFEQSPGHGEPPIPEGHLRLWNGGGSDWYTTDRPYAERFATGERASGPLGVRIENPKLYYVDVPLSDPAVKGVENLQGGRLAHFAAALPESLVRTRQLASLTPPEALAGLQGGSSPAVPPPAVTGTPFGPKRAERTTPETPQHVIDEATQMFRSMGDGAKEAKAKVERAAAGQSFATAEELVRATVARPPAVPAPPPPPDVQTPPAPPPGTKVKADPGNKFRAFELPDELLGRRAMSSGTDWWDGMPFLAEIAPRGLSTVAHHPDHQSGTITAEVVRRIYYYPEAYDHGVIDKYVAELKSKYPNAEFIRIHGDDNSDPVVGPEPPKQPRTAFQAAPPPEPLQAPATPFRKAETPEDHAQRTLQENEQHIDDILRERGLTDREALIVKERDLKKRTLRDIAKDLGVSYETVRNDETKAHDKLKIDKSSTELTQEQNAPEVGSRSDVITPDTASAEAQATVSAMNRQGRHFNKPLDRQTRLEALEVKRERIYREAKKERKNGTFEANKDRFMGRIREVDAEIERETRSLAGEPLSVGAGGDVPQGGLDVPPPVQRNPEPGLRQGAGDAEAQAEVARSGPAAQGNAGAPPAAAGGSQAPSNRLKKPRRIMGEMEESAPLTEAEKAQQAANKIKIDEAVAWLKEQDAQKKEARRVEESLQGPRLTDTEVSRAHEIAQQVAGPQADAHAAELAPEAERLAAAQVAGEAQQPASQEPGRGVPQEPGATP